MIKLQRVFYAFALACSLPALSFALVEFPGKPLPGAAIGTITADSIILENSVIRQTWAIIGNKLVPGSITDKISGTSRAFTASEIFEFESGSLYKGSTFSITQKPTGFTTIVAKSQTDIKIANRFDGKTITLILQSADGNFGAIWNATLLNESNYIRQSVGITNKTSSAKQITMFYYLHQNAAAPVYQGVSTGNQCMESGTGRGYGSTIGDGPFFFGLEAVYAGNAITTNGTRKEISFFFPSVASIPPNGTNTKGMVCGVAPQGQMRRAFNYYISRERSHYYRMFPHYDAWYDLTYNYTEALMLNRIQTFGRELTRNRKFALLAYQADDGWDNASKAPAWMNFNASLLPRGFTMLKDSAAKYQAGMGIWFGPGGGYGGKAERIAANTSLGAETQNSTQGAGTCFTMAGPNYFNICKNSFRDKILNHGLKVIKFDAMLLHAYDIPFFEHMDGIERFNDSMRVTLPDIYLNGMGGSHPSPFYLLHFDSYWHGNTGDAGHLTASWAGTNQRETWVSYRDACAWDAVSLRSSVIPLNSIAHHGITIGDQLYPANWPLDITSIKHEVRSFFGVGTGCQDLLISPNQMNADIYDVIAEAGIWAKSNEDIMEDAHWIGGNIRNGEVYGYASWSKRGGTISLRNPKISAQSITLDIGTVFELPTNVDGVASIYELKSPWKEDAAKPSDTLKAGTPHTFNLAALETKQFDARTLNGTSIFNPGTTTGTVKRNTVSITMVNGTLAISFSTVTHVPVHLALFAINGKRVYLQTQNVNAGTHRIVWGRHCQGMRALSKGIYLAEVKVGSEVVRGSFATLE